ncbi:PTS sugar transporter subunit IIA [Spirochaeta isovalerica]|uniref:Mannitol/fructose-specific phosphotransferase system IIA component (Ntr-type) n=1 Tax=Spirochaeta isovalerica TaxID=150 RepID=A0A841RCM1_9SPIO|nr:PTS sugar transporter subunit IIA [Spirochaeta isovalerica]MBB6481416.1 mannitol/fructose-specific phosphotransferase system IIA component (Ntr-type) [Spirochaeta isovalerica]
MGVISAKLKAECILVDPPETEKEELFRHLVDTLASVYGIEEPDLLYQSILKREEMVSTCIGYGCAVPHCQSESLEKTLFAAARLDPPRDFDTPDGQPVSLVFLMAGPAKNTGSHIRLLSKLARFLHDPQFREDLEKAVDAGDFHRIISLKDQ